MYKQLPNVLTLLRLVLASCFFLTLNQYRYLGAENPQSLVMWSAIVLFCLGALTDILDGHLARKWKVESVFGRIMDPFCDKVLIIGAFIYLAGPRFIIPEKADHFYNMITGVYPWMVVVILSRELLVTGIRGELEAMGINAGANIWGKLKMMFQSVVVPFILLFVWIDPERVTWLGWVRDVLVYMTVIITILSGLPYVIGGRRAMMSGRQ